uniref:Uncharacterized protein n=1 Tax=Hordeum vulgare subsp. vulgare TaxID=112509 RepID=A0A8I6XIB7_HORVV
MSNYMMHLLFENPEMLMPGSRRNLLSGACDELHQLLQDDKTPRDERGFTLRVMEIFDAESESVIHPGQDEPVNPNLCMTNNNSIVHNAWRLAKILLCLCDDLGDGGGQTRMWKVIQGVWVEMLCFSAGRSRGYLHAEALGTGVEYLSYIWILWAYSGMETFADKLQRREGLIRQ